MVTCLGSWFFFCKRFQPRLHITSISLIPDKKVTKEHSNGLWFKHSVLMNSELEDKLTTKDVSTACMLHRPRQHSFICICFVNRHIHTIPLNKSTQCFILSIYNVHQKCNEYTQDVMNCPTIYEGSLNICQMFEKHRLKHQKYQFYATNLPVPSLRHSTITSAGQWPSRPQTHVWPTLLSKQACMWLGKCYF